MSIAKDKDPSIRVKMHQTFFYFEDFKDLAKGKASDKILGD